ncbi:excinuclease ABC subunit UvrC [Gynuella sunshinyii]|nr:excinuclease ABC subunit UvrC [Gynuella sunshinyii]
MTEFDPKSFVKSLPNKPGVYQMLGEDNELLYVGKAKNLKARVGSYFHSRGLTNKTVALVSHICHINVTITHSETEALLLEQTLIKTHKPPYNIMLVDDKGYPYLLLSDQTFPGIHFHRGSKRKKGTYFGPYPGASAVREALSVLQKAFKVRQCEDSVFSNRTRPCLQYQIKRCKAPCVGLVSEDEYKEDVLHTRLFLEGKSNDLIQQLEIEMDRAASDLNFEKAAEIRDQLLFVRKIQEQQFVAGQAGNVDVLAMELQASGCCIAMIIIRDGRVLGSRQFFPRIGLEEEAETAFEAFIGQYYFGQRNHEIPNEIMTNLELANYDLFSAAFEQEFNRKVKFSHNVRGDRRKWLNLAVTNATEQLALHIANRKSILGRFTELEKQLQWETDIERIECFDISHSQGEATVASCVVFGREGPLKSDYRRFNITGITGGDDYAAMEQALTRRYKRLMVEEHKLPTILMVDGGKGQLNVARRVMDELQMNQTLLMGIAKGEGRKPGLETLYLQDAEHTLELEKHSPAFHLLQHIRDEAHRFAITGHRGKRGKARTGSLLDDIPGIGAERRKALIRYFGSARGVMAASADEIAKVKGISKTIAQNIYEFLHN